MGSCGGRGVSQVISFWIFFKAKSVWLRSRLGVGCEEEEARMTPRTVSLFACLPGTWKAGVALAETVTPAGEQGGRQVGVRSA